MKSLIFLVLIMVSNITYARCSYPNFLIKGEVLACKATHVTDGGFSVLTLKVLEESLINLWAPFEVKNPEEFSILNQDIEVVVPISSMACHHAMHSKLDQDHFSMLLYRVCCDVKQDICENKTHPDVYRGVFSNDIFKSVREPKASYDEGYNFSKEDVPRCPVHNKSLKQDK